MARQFVSADNTQKLLAQLMVAPLAGVVTILFAIHRVAPHMAPARILSTLVLCTLLAAVNSTLLVAFAVWRRQVAGERRLAWAKAADR